MVHVLSTFRPGVPFDGQAVSLSQVLVQVRTWGDQRHLPQPLLSDEHEAMQGTLEAELEACAELLTGPVRRVVQSLWGLVKPVVASTFASLSHNNSSPPLFEAVIVLCRQFYVFESVISVDDTDTTDQSLIRRDVQAVIRGSWDTTLPHLSVRVQLASLIAVCLQDSVHCDSDSESFLTAAEGVLESSATAVLEGDAAGSDSDYGIMQRHQWCLCTLLPAFARLVRSASVWNPQVSE